MSSTSMKVTRVLVSIVPLLFTDCETAVESTDAGGTSSCEQSCQDFNSALAISRTIDFIYDQNLAGKPVGRHDLPISCPTGGNVHITGTTEFDSSHDLTTMHLVFDMASCRSVGSNYDVTMTGKLSADGTFGTNQTALTYTGTMLGLSGTAGGGIAKLADSCDVSITRKVGSESGALCGRTFSGILK
jgi:hypothetical protein